jgi:hypothetical protein
VNIAATRPYSKVVQGTGCSGNTNQVEKPAAAKLVIFFAWMIHACSMLEYIGAQIDMILPISELWYKITCEVSGLFTT